MKNAIIVLLLVLLTLVSAGVERDARAMIEDTTRRAM